jgi:Cd2+/Zn2+-exporting ATPase
MQILCRSSKLALISISEKPAGLILFGDQIRPGITSMVQRLRNLGVRQTVMLTGDSFENAQKIAQQIRIVELSSVVPPLSEGISWLIHHWSRSNMHTRFFSFLF